MGLAKVRFIALFVVMAANLRLADTFELRQRHVQHDGDRAARDIVKKTRKPRWRTRLRYEMNDRIAARKALRDAKDGTAGAAPPPTLTVIPSSDAG